MNAIELALEKQRLQLEAASQRVALGDHLQGLAPLIDAADRLQEGVRWVKRHPEIVATGIALLAAVRPGTRRFLWRWGKRAFLAWQFWRANFPSRVLAPFKR
ncbi:YqjK-like family protein [Sulfuricystis multivorans]|uniref:YqjK-like family protein n=1 Tax=Sulfuricystis multivorans TaxID=2211108 RepID=UPI000F833BC1|nr:YqjK-like family protein [Sulfuricystis multivorans]